MSINRELAEYDLSAQHNTDVKRNKGYVHILMEWPEGYIVIWKLQGRENIHCI